MIQTSTAVDQVQMFPELRKTKKVVKTCTPVRFG